MKIFLRILILLFLSGIILFSWNTFNIPYESLAEKIIPKEIFISKQSMIKSDVAFTIERYHSLRKGVILTASFIGGILIWIMIFPSFLLRLLSSLKEIAFNGFNQIKLQYHYLSKFEKSLFIIISIFVILFKVLLTIYTEVNVDEIATDRYFISKGLLTTLTYYPELTNHIFFNTISLIPYNLVDNGIMAMRITSVISNLLLLAFLFFFTLRRFGFIAACCSIILSSFIMEATIYGALGRGHIWMCLFAIISLWSFLNYLEHNNKGFLFILIASSALGLFTVPTYLYFLISGFIYGIFSLIRKKEYFRILEFTLSGIGIFILTIIFFMPVILVNGWDILISNPWVQPLSTTQFNQLYPVYIKEYSEYILGTIQYIRRSYLIMIIIIPGWIILYRNLKNVKEKEWLIMLSIFFFTPLAIIFFQKIFPSYRFFTYVIFLFHIGCGITLNYIFDQIKLSLNFKYGVLILIFIIFLYTGISTMIL